MAKLYFRYGAMNSGKSTALLQAAFNYEERGQRVLLAKPLIDTKGASQIVSRLGVTREVDFVIPADGDVERIYAEHADYVDHDALIESIDAPKIPVACLLIDEAQFLNPVQVDSLMRIATTASVPVMCYGIRTDFQTKAFPVQRDCSRSPTPSRNSRRSAAAAARRCSTAASSTERSSSTAIRSPSTAIP